MRNFFLKSNAIAAVLLLGVAGSASASGWEVWAEKQGSDRLTVVTSFSGDGELDEAQIDAFGDVLARLSETRRLAVRIDCALLPFLAGSGRTTPEDVRAYGVMGCEAGRSLLAVRADGRAAPCSFWQSGERSALPEAPPESASLDRAWHDDAVLAQFRDYQTTLPEPCASCEFRASCRGGCRIVAAAIGTTPWAPDPECPRVRAHARAQAL